MIPVLLSVIALVSYCFGNINSPVFASTRFEGLDVRRRGSCNASFANYAAVLGTKKIWKPAAVDVVKTAIPCLLGMLLMKIPGEGYPRLGAAFAGFCCVLGDCFPWRYCFKGNMGVICCATALWLTDWRVGLIACIFYVVALGFGRILSLADFVLAFSGPILCWCFVPYSQLRGLSGLLALFSALVILLRQRKAVGRIRKGTEPRIHLGKQADDLMNDEI